MSDTNPVVHFEMGYEDKDRMVKFYESVFGWKMRQMGPDMGNYVVAETAETDADHMVQQKGAINGGFYQKSDDPVRNAPSIVVSVKDIHSCLQAVLDAGGKNLGTMNEKMEPTDVPQMIPGVGLWISVQDTEGNRFSMLQPRS
jgi:uncharacterized protein